MRLHRDAPIGRELAITHTASGTVLALEVPDNFVVVAEVNDPRWVGVTGVELMRLAGRLGAQLAPRSRACPAKYSPYAPRPSNLSAAMPFGARAR